MPGHIENVKEDEEVTLDECIDIKTETSYKSKCEFCSYEVITSRKYLAFQSMKSHKTSCSALKAKKLRKASKCEECDMIINESESIKRHMRDCHEILTVSMSPPPKKKKKSISDKKEEEIVEMETESTTLDELSTSLEDIEIDISEDESPEELSKKMDTKIGEKESKHEERESLLKTKRKHNEERKAKMTMNRDQQAKESQKKKKQKEKDSKKIERKKRKASQNIHVKNVGNIANNLKAVPENCRHLVQEGDVLYVVPGDGCCGPNCAAALLFHDEVFGPKLRRRMNLFFANHWNRRYQHISQCSPGHPYKRKIKDGEIEFTDPDQLIKFLKHSSDAAYICGLTARI